jgi:hypothetical protein
MLTMEREWKREYSRVCSRDYDDCVPRELSTQYKMMRCKWLMYSKTSPDFIGYINIMGQPIFGVTGLACRKKS